MVIWSRLHCSLETIQSVGRMQNCWSVGTDQFWQLSCELKDVLQLYSDTIKYLDFEKCLAISHLVTALLIQSHSCRCCTECRHKVSLVVRIGHVVDDPLSVIEVIQVLLVLASVIRGWVVNFEVVESIVQVSSINERISKNMWVLQHMNDVFWNLVTLSSSVGRKF